ncbi:GntR family transcriptional regulator [Ruegeria sp. PrR005]|nr:GntR family transcriptional regulator [Ruegeria sp. PrR005]
MDMAGVTQIKRPDSLSKIAAEQIREEIVRGRFQLGEPLPEAKLSAMFGISKTPIREALAALKLQGLVQIFPQRGAFVFTLSRNEIVQLCGYRVILEHAALDLSFAQDRAGIMDELEQVVAAMAKAHAERAFERYLDLDADFHDAFFNHCGNAYLSEGYRKVGDIVRTMRTHLSKGPQRTDKSRAEHEEIVRLLRTRQIDSAKEVLHTQITRGERAYSDLATRN